MPEPAPLRLIVDTDIGCDDAIGLMLAFRTPGVRVELITTVVGNASVEQATRNALAVAEHCGVDLRVHAGAAVPLNGELPPRRGTHGRNGLGDIELPLRSGRVQPEPAYRAICELARAEPGQLTLLTLGPLTNVALAIQHEPALPLLLSGCIITAGAVRGPGTVTPAAEFNVRHDAEAARIVLAAGLMPTIVPVELSRGEARLTPAEQAALANSPDTATSLAGLLCQHLGRMGLRRGWQGEAALPDAVGTAVAIRPGLLSESRECFVDVETRGELTRGALVADVEGILQRPANARVASTLDVAGFRSLLSGAFGVSLT